MMDDYDVPQEVLEAWAAECRCCAYCMPAVCGAVMQGAPCERACWCDSDDEWDDESGPYDWDNDTD